MVVLILKALLSSRLLNLKRKVHNWTALCYAAQGDDVHMWGETHGYILQSHSPTCLYQCSWEFHL